MQIPVTTVFNSSKKFAFFYCCTKNPCIAVCNNTHLLSDSIVAVKSKRAQLGSQGTTKLGSGLSQKMPY